MVAGRVGVAADADVAPAAAAAVVVDDDDDATAAPFPEASHSDVPQQPSPRSGQRSCTEIHTRVSVSVSVLVTPVVRQQKEQ